MRVGGITVSLAAVWIECSPGRQPFPVSSILISRLNSLVGVTNLDLRRYEPADRERVLELHEEALRATGEYIEDVPAEVEADLRDIEGAYLQPGGEFLVGEMAGAIVAMGGFRPVEGSWLREIDDDRTAELKRLRVDPVHQRRGYGERVLQALEERAREQGFERMALDTAPELTAARRLYEKHSYEQTGRREFRDGVLAVVLYQKVL